MKPIVHRPSGPRPVLRRTLRPSGEIELDAIVDTNALDVDWDAAMPQDAYDWPWHFGQTLKRLFDIVASGAGLLILLPFFVIIGLLILLDSPGSVFYPWVVVGFRGRRFVGYKFRTMVMDADRLKDEFAHLNEMEGPVFKIRNDPRVTRLGRWLRKYSIDELPQLWSVFVGHMSLVGPRPLSRTEFIEATPEQRQKLSIRPGITCLWQVSGRSSITSFQEWVDLDLLYIRTWTFSLDIQILLRTIPVVLRGRHAY